MLKSGVVGAALGCVGGVGVATTIFDGELLAL